MKLSASVRRRWAEIGLGLGTIATAAALVVGIQSSQAPVRAESMTEACGKQVGAIQKALPEKVQGTLVGLPSAQSGKEIAGMVGKALTQVSELDDAAAKAVIGKLVKDKDVFSSDIQNVMDTLSKKPADKADATSKEAVSLLLAVVVSVLQCLVPSS
ncbi:hypothetical protein [Nocardia sp. NPDC051570]|uniref:hypothetical protein n=1 Tax=Nocardia sp. NPDC051570 TaxID=3364324 RepID=UPI00378FE6AB